MWVRERQDELDARLLVLARKGCYMRSVKVPRDAA